MAKHLRLIALIGFFIFGLCALSFAQSTESVSITTYYPSPYGVYRTMRLHPGPRPTGACQNGEIYYDDGSDAIPNPIGLYVCNTGAWESFSVGPVTSDFWEVSANNANAIVNTNTGIVKVGTDVNDGLVDYTMHVNQGNAYKPFMFSGTSTTWKDIIWRDSDSNERWKWAHAIHAEGNRFDVWYWDSALVPPAWQGPYFTIRTDGRIGIGTPYPDFAGHKAKSAGRNVLTVMGSSDQGVLEVASGAADAEWRMMGQYSFVAKDNIGEKRIATIGSETEGTTANKRGGILKFYTRPAGDFAELDPDNPQMIINSAGMVNIGKRTFDITGLKSTKPKLNVYQGDTEMPIRIEGTENEDKCFAMRDSTTGQEWHLSQRQKDYGRGFGITYYDGTDWYNRFVITPGGNVGIGTTDPGTNKLKVDGGKFRAEKNVYDSGWFAISRDNEYTKIHNLGTTALIVQLWLSDFADGHDAWIPANDFSFAMYYVAVDKMTTTDIHIITSSGGWKYPCTDIFGSPSFCSNISNNTVRSNGFCRVLIWALE